MSKYNPKKIEKKIQKFWLKNNFFKTKVNTKKKKYFCLSMIPYPSGNLHMGHVRNYILGDIIARYQKLKDKNILHPIGWDAFGLPAENAAIENNLNPYTWTVKNIKIMKKQLKKLGISYDWDREIKTCDPKYYKWEQWLFIKLYKKKLIYKKRKIVNWCNKDKTVLANEQVINNKCWRCNALIKKKKLSQWFIKITKYADKLLEDLKYLKKWPPKVKKIQKNWIGKTKGFKIKLNIENIKKKLYIYTSKINILTSVRCISISKYHKLIRKNKNKKKIYKKINLLEKKKINNIWGLYSKINAIHPITKTLIPIWITNFTEELYNNDVILISSKYNEKHKIFIKKYNINKIKLIIKNKLYKKRKFIKKIKKEIKKKIILNIWKKKKNFKLKDWSISRQRYWGVPIPIVKINKKIQTVKIKELPIKLPLYKKINKKNLNPLKKDKFWSIIKKKNKKITRETDTFDTFMESSWYYARCTSPKYNKKIFNIKKANYWLPINLYIGGIEHATMHLIYFRFIHKIMKDLKLVICNEPATKIICQGIVLTKTFFYIKNNKKIWINPDKIKKIKNKFYCKKNKKIRIYYAGINKMSKSKNNGINPNKIINKYGADTLRIFIIFSAPIEQNLIWKEKGIKGCFRFLNKLWNLVVNFKNKNKNKYIFKKKTKTLILVEKKIIYITKNMNLSTNLNSIIAKIMEFTNLLIKLNNKKINFSFIKENIKKLLILLYPFAPHISYYLLTKIYHNKNINNDLKWPKINKDILNKEKYINIVVQINGKKKTIIKIKKNINKKILVKKIKKLTILNKLKIKKNIYIKNKIINFVTH